MGSMVGGGGVGSVGMCLCSCGGLRIVNGVKEWWDRDWKIGNYGIGWDGDIGLGSMGVVMWRMRLWKFRDCGIGAE